MESDVVKRYRALLEEFRKFADPPEYLYDMLDHLWFRMTAEERSQWGREIRTDRVTD
jgi:hypothetical protein